MSTSFPRSAHDAPTPEGFAVFDASAGTISVPFSSPLAAGSVVPGQVIVRNTSSGDDYIADGQSFAAGSLLVLNVVPFGPSGGGSTTTEYITPPLSIVGAGGGAVQGFADFPTVEVS